MESGQPKWQLNCSSTQHLHHGKTIRGLASFSGSEESGPGSLGHLRSPLNQASSTTWASYHTRPRGSHSASALSILGQSAAHPSCRQLSSRSPPTSPFSKVLPNSNWFHGLRQPHSGLRPDSAVSFSLDFSIFTLTSARGTRGWRPQPQMVTWGGTRPGLGCGGASLLGFLSLFAGARLCISKRTLSPTGLLAAESQACNQTHLCETSRGKGSPGPKR